jgi:hypothetical protein
MKGFTFPYGRKDIFVSTELVNKTQKLASKILKELVNIGYDVPDNPDTRNELLYYLQKAECDIHTLPNRRQYYEIHGDNFGGKGSFIDDGNTIIIKL